MAQIHLVFERHDDGQFVTLHRVPVAEYGQESFYNETRSFQGFMNRIRQHQYQLFANGTVLPRPDHEGPMFTFPETAEEVVAEFSETWEHKSLRDCFTKIQYDAKGRKLDGMPLKKWRKILPGETAIYAEKDLPQAWHTQPSVANWLKHYRTYRIDYQRFYLVIYEGVFLGVINYYGGEDYRAFLDLPKTGLSTGGEDDEHSSAYCGRFNSVANAGLAMKVRAEKAAQAFTPILKALKRAA